MNFLCIQRDCPDGLLSKTKFLEVYSTFFPTGNPDKFCNHVFRSFDGDNSGKIDFKEFLLAINITSGGDPKSKLNWAFTMYDIDGNGTIEKDEMVEIIGVSLIIVLFWKLENFKIKYMYKGFILYFIVLMISLEYFKSTIFSTVYTFNLDVRTTGHFF